MSTSGIRNNGINRPIAPKELIPTKKKDEKQKSGETTSIKDSFSISGEGLKLDKALKDLANVKSFLANTSVDSEKLIQSATSGLEPQFLKDEAKDILENLANVVDQTLANPQKATAAQANISPENVLKLELPEISEITATFEMVEKFISDNPKQALSAQANIQ